MTDTAKLQARIDALLGDIESEFPRTKVARALIAKACAHALIDVGALPTMKMMTHATSLLAGHWTAENVASFIETKD